MAKTDLTKLYKTYYQASKNPEIIELGAAQYLSLVGKGDPSAQAFTDNIQALYATAYAIKFQCKEAGHDFVVPKLEALWWFDATKYSNLSIAATPLKVPRSEWEYRLLIRMPDFVAAAAVTAAIAAVVHKKQLVKARDIELFSYWEGKCVQVLHVGPFDREPETLEQIAAFSALKGLVKRGLHHEIYLSDFRKTPQEKLKTILREPVF
jgi:hypothetical protein